MSSVAIIVGAAGGIGAATARVLAGAGDTVVLVDRSAPPADVAALTASELVFEIDATDAGAMEEMVAAVAERLGRIDVLVNAVGVLDETPFHELSVESWRRTIEIDLTAVFLACRFVIPVMMQQAEGGAIVSVASQTAVKGVPLSSPYVAAKAGVMGLTRSLAREYGPAIRVNAVAPGPVDTGMIAPMADADWVARRAGESVIGRLAEPEEVARVIAYLAGPDATLFHGQTLHSNGGGVMP